MNSPGRKISIIGGTGKMGRWFAKFFKEKGFHVQIAGRSLSKTKRVAAQLDVSFAPLGKTAVEDADLVMVATTLISTPSVILKTAPFMKRDAVLMDIASLKRDSVSALKKAEAHGVQCISLHPMFGPTAKTMAGKNVVIIPVSNLKGDLKRFLKVFTDSGARVVVLPSAQIHDEIMAFTLALPHFLNIVFGQTLSALGKNTEELRKLAGTTFTLQFLLAGSVLQEDPHTYGSLQIDNKASHRVLTMCAQKADELKRIVRRRDRRKFVEFFEEAKNYMAKSEEFKDYPKKIYDALESLKLNS